MHVQFIERCLGESCTECIGQFCEKRGLKGAQRTRSSRRKDGSAPFGLGLVSAGNASRGRSLVPSKHIADEPRRAGPWGLPQ